MVNKDKHIEKILKLMALQKDAQALGSLSEAANAAAKVQALLLKHNLSLEEIEVSKKADIIEKNLKTSSVGWNKRKGSAIIDLYSFVARANFCKALYGRNSEDIGIRLIGEPHNIACVEFFVIQILESISILHKKAWKNYDGHLKKNKFFRSFYTGACDAICVKIEKERRKAEEQVDIQALVLVKDAKLTEYLKNVKSKSVNRRNQEHNDGYVRGYKDGEGIYIKKGIDGQENTGD